MPQDFAAEDELNSTASGPTAVDGAAVPTPSALSLLSGGGAPTPTPGGGPWTPQTNATVSSDFTPEQTLMSTAAEQKPVAVAGDGDAAGASAKSEAGGTSSLGPNDKLTMAKGSPQGSLGSVGTGRLSPPGSKGLGGGGLLAPLRGFSPGQATPGGGLAPIRLSPGSGGGGGLGGSPGSNLGGPPGVKAVGEAKRTEGESTAGEALPSAAEAKEAARGDDGDGDKPQQEKHGGASDAPVATLAHEDSGASFASDDTGTPQQASVDARRSRALEQAPPSALSAVAGAGEVGGLTPSARGWGSDRVETHIREVLGMQDMARLFKERRLDSKAVTHFEREDFTAAPPGGFGMAEDDPNLDQVS